MTRLAEIKFTTDRFESQVIRKIAARAVALCLQTGVRVKPIDIEMDLSAVHANGNPLRLEALLEADDFNLLHDVLGIRRHLDRATGKLTDCFSPRFSKG